MFKGRAIILCITDAVLMHLLHQGLFQLPADRFGMIVPAGSFATLESDPSQNTWPHLLMS